MRDVLDDEGRRFGPASLLALTAMALMSVSILYNALLAQPGGNRTTAGNASNTSAGATTRIDVPASSAARNTIQLKYDPLVEDVQRELLAAGYYKGMVDGVVGKKTRDAISAYQQATGLEATGLPSPNLVDHIRYTRQIAEASLFTGSIAADADADAEQRARIRRVQTGLAELAYFQSGITGEMNDQTHQAIKQFERDRGLAESGEISDALMTELAKLSGQSATTPQ